MIKCILRKHIMGLTAIIAVLKACMFSSCNIINPDEPIPSYLRIDSIEKFTNPFTQGSASAKISDAWIFINDQAIGAFELPCLVPILDQGNTNVVIRAGIRINGIAALRFPFPFYDFYSEQVQLTPDSITNITPKVTYFPDVNFAYRANFDDPSGITLEPLPSSDTTIWVVNDPSLVFEGAGSAYSIISRDSASMVFQSTVVMDLPKNNRTVYLEMDYKVNGLLDVGLVTLGPASTFARSSLTLNPTNSWNKVYINLTENVSLTPNASGYRLYFRAMKEPGNPPLELFLDNLKVLYIN
jgi:hypothetical protein